MDGMIMFMWLEEAMLTYNTILKSTEIYQNQLKHKSITNSPLESKF